MSAYICDHDTFRYLAAAASVYRVTVEAPSGIDDPRTLPFIIFESRTPYTVTLFATGNEHIVAAVLYASNADSVNFRYRESQPLICFESLQPTYLHRDCVDAVMVLKSVACLRYQSCERPGYYDTFGARLLDEIERAAIRNLPGYDDAPWGWTRRHDGETLRYFEANGMASSERAQ